MGKNVMSNVAAKQLAREILRIAMDKMDRQRSMLMRRENYSRQPDEKKAELKNIENIDAGSNTTLQKEIQGLETLESKITQHLLPRVGAMDEVLKEAIREVKEKNDAFVAKLMSEAIDLVYSKIYYPAGNRQIKLKGARSWLHWIKP
jgi:hypothetical protein